MTWPVMTTYTWVLGGTMFQFGLLTQFANRDLASHDLPRSLGGLTFQCVSLTKFTSHDLASHNSLVLLTWVLGAWCSSPGIRLLFIPLWIHLLAEWAVVWPTALCRSDSPICVGWNINHLVKNDTWALGVLNYDLANHKFLAQMLH